MVCNGFLILTLSSIYNVEIKNFIQNAYDTWEYPPNFICIIGDADGPYAVPTFTENLSLHNGEGDHPYTLLEGDDYISDVNIGRLSIRSLSDLANISNKIINSVSGINRVVYDITSKPPSTIELE